MKSKKLILILFYCFQAICSAQKKYEHERKNAAHLTLSRKIPIELIESIKDLMLSNAELISIHIHFESLHSLIANRWFYIEVTDDMSLTDLHSCLSSQLRKDKECFRLIKKELLKSTPLPNASYKTLKEFGIQNNNRIKAEEQIREHL